MLEFHFDDPPDVRLIIGHQHAPAGPGRGTGRGRSDIEIH
jgi:hypothetical protein